MRSGAIVKSFNNLHASKKTKTDCQKCRKLPRSHGKTLKLNGTTKISWEMSVSPTFRFLSQNQKQTNKKNTHTTPCDKAPNATKNECFFFWDIYIQLRWRFFSPFTDRKKKHSRNHLLQSEAPPRGPPWWMEVGWLVTWLMKGRKKKMGVN